MIKPTVLFLLVLTHSFQCTKLPSSFKKCNRNQKDFNECLAAAIKDALLQLSSPFPEIGLPVIEPLKIPSLTIDAGASAVQFIQDYKDVTVSGLTHPSTITVKTFDENTLIAELVFPEVRLEFNYEVDGKVLILPIKGKGPGLIVLEKPDCVITFSFEEYKKRNEKYYKVTDTKMSIDPQRAHMKLENLFDGNQALGYNINQVINDNWQEVYADVKPLYERAFAKIAGSVFGAVLSKVPVDEIFGSE